MIMYVGNMVTALGCIDAGITCIIDNSHNARSAAHSDAAIQALQKQIEINPYDEYAYNALGQAYWQQRKYDAAATAFHKQIEINPLDKYAHAGLGTMYSEWNK